MKQDRTTRRRSEDGIALLIAIFVLLLVSVVAIALLVSSGTETALGANYRSSSTVYYAALAGLEEARGRLLPKNPNYFDSIDPSVIPTPFPLGQTTYVINRLTGESIVPWDSSNQYYDKEYQSEFAVPASSASWHGVSSVWDNNAQGIPGPLYKWVRINAVTEQAIYIDVNSSGTYNSTLPLFYDVDNVDLNGNLFPSLIRTSSPPSSATQALEITALSALPNGSQKYLQYLVAPITLDLIFPAAITLDGNGVQYAGPGSAQFYVKGGDQGTSGSCVPGATNYPAIGYTNNSDSGGISSAETPAGNYQGWGGTPSLGLVAPTSGLQSLAQLENLVQTVSQEHDVLINGPATGSDLPLTMSPTNPLTIMVNGDLDLNGWHNTGYGILLVTGELKYDPDAFWNGIVLVIGKGKFTLENSGFGTIYGALFIAKTVDLSGLPLVPPAPLGAATFAHAAGNGGVGVYYSSCWINYVQKPMTYKVLSFHELPKQ